MPRKNLSKSLSKISPRELLEGARKQRQSALHAHAGDLYALSGKFEEYEQTSLQKRHELLLIEIPYVIDTVALAQSRSEMMIEYTNQCWMSGKKCSIDLWASEVMKNKGDQTVRSYKIATLKNRFNKYRPQIAYATKKPLPVTDREIAESRLVREMMRQELEKDQRIKESTKSEIQSHLNQVFGLFPSLPINMTFLPNTISLESLAVLCQYLEERCLKGYYTDYYRDLVEVRLLCHLPISYQKNDRESLSREAIDPEKMTISYRGRSYPMPKNVIDLVESLYTPKEKIFKRNPHDFHAFLKRMLVAAGISHGIHVQKFLSNSVSTICQEERLFSDLPRR